MASMRKLQKKVAWISGASSGIGEATARLFSREGAKVALIGRRAVLGRRIGAELKSEGAEVLTVACDVSKQAEVRDSIRRTADAFGGVDIFVNNAGMVHINSLHQY